MRPNNIIDFGDDDGQEKRKPEKGDERPGSEVAANIID